VVEPVTVPEPQPEPQPEPVVDTQTTDEDAASEDCSPSVREPVKLDEFMEGDGEEITIHADVGCIDAFTGYLFSSVTALVQPMNILPVPSINKFQVISSGEEFDVDEANEDQKDAKGGYVPSPVKYSYKKRGGANHKTADNVEETEEVTQAASCFQMKPLLDTVMGTPRKSPPKSNRKSH
jgi:hypothetical protein